MTSACSPLPLESTTPRVTYSAEHGLLTVWIEPSPSEDEDLGGEPGVVPAAVALERRHLDLLEMTLVVQPPVAAARSANQGAITG